MDNAAPSSRPNAGQIEAWNGPMSERWLKQYDVIASQMAPLGERVMDHLAVGAGERVLDIGCGTGDTTRALGRRVGAAGHVLGIDISRPLLDAARRRAAEEGAANVEFAEADVQTHRFAPASFDALYSRFGVMFFEDPAAAFANLHGALRSGGRLAFVCWRSREENPFMTLVNGVAAEFMDEPPAPFDPLAPGPFAFADAERVRSLLTGAGFRDIAVAPFDDVYAGPAHDIRGTMERREPLRSVLESADPAKQVRIIAALDAVLAPFRTGGQIALPARTWLVTART